MKAQQNGDSHNISANTLGKKKKKKITEDKTQRDDISMQRQQAA